MGLEPSTSAALSRWIIDSAADFAIIATDTDGRVTSWSRGARDILGWTEAEMLGDTVERIFTPEDRASGRVETEMRLARQTGAGADERWHVRKGGERFWASGELTPLRDDDGEVLGYVKVLRDRTAQHSLAMARAQEASELEETGKALRESRSYLRLLLDSTAEGFYAVDREGVTTMTNSAFLRMMGFKTEEDAVGRKLHDVIHHTHPDGSPFPADECPLYRCAREGIPAHIPEDVFHRTDGRPVAVEYWATPIIRDGVHEGAICTFLDISERKLAEAERESARARLQEMYATLEALVQARTRERDTIWQVSKDMLGVADSQGVWLSVNPAWTQILGWPPDAFIGRTSEWLEHPDDRERTRAEVRSLAGGEPSPAFENRFRTQAGDYRDLSWTAVPVDGLLYCVSRDVTEQKRDLAALARTEEALRQSQKLEAVGQLTGGVAHDFNNLLTIIRSSVDFLRRSDLLETRRLRYIEAISDTVERASKLTGQLLAFARRQPLKPTIFDVGQQVRSVVDLIRPLMGARVRIESELCDPACFTEADVSQFETALVNLSVNARDAMDGEGRLTIRIEEVASVPPIRGHLTADGAFIAISVTDTGSGIEPSRLASIFEPFFTTKAVGKGTGLGLSQVFGFAKQSGGEIDVRSTPGEGASFTLYLPRVSPPGSGQPLAPDLPGRSASGEGLRVLVVEDNEAVGGFATELLGDLGYKTRWVGNAAAALAVLETDHLAFDVVFSDIVMPGMGGVDLAQTIKSRYPGLPVVLTSGYSNVLAQEGRHGFELLQKPYSVETLSRIIQKAAAG